MAGIECAGFTFYNEFDSANLAKVSYVPPNESPVTLSTAPGKSVPEIPDAEFNLWTKPDCFGTEFENGNRTWFYFGVKAHLPCLLVRLNIVDLNRQGKMYSQGMAPVYRVVPGKPQWERIRDKPLYNTTDDIFTLSFKFKTPENVQSITYFAFTYPFSYADLQKMLQNIELKFQNYTPTSNDDIYYTNEVVCNSLGGRDVNLLTISSYHGITTETEVRLKDLFPNKNVVRPFKFLGKKVIFVSARVHPGESPSTFVFNGLLNLLLNRDDPVAIILRRLYVFKMIPFLNPDGVSLGHYRTDTRGVNLNRVYLNPSVTEHPSVYAARQLIRYHHFNCEKDDFVDKSTQINTEVDEDNTQNDSGISTKVSHMSLEENKCVDPLWCIKCKNFIIPLSSSGSELPSDKLTTIINFNKSFYLGSICRSCKSIDSAENVKVNSDNVQGDENSNESGLFLYIDLHGHASKKGIFMYGNHFEDLEKGVECMLLPKILSINNHNFHFTACNFTERNMYLKDRRDGMSREGSGRVAVLKLTGLTKSYTLECNYNTGRIVNVLPPTVKETHGKPHTISVPPKYTPQIFEELGKSLGASILDLSGQNPCTRIPNSEFHNLSNLQDWIRVNAVKDFNAPRTIQAKLKFRNVASLHNEGKTAHGIKVKTKPNIKTVTKRTPGLKIIRPNSVPIERKENVVNSLLHPQPSCSHSATELIKSSIRLNRNLGIKSKPKKDFSHKYNKLGSAVTNKQKIVRNRIKTAVASSQKIRLDNKLQKKQNLNSMKQEKSKKAERVKLRELCLMKENGEKGAAKFKQGVSKEIESSDVYLSWKPSCSSQIYDKKCQSASNFVADKINSEVGSSKSASFRVSNFAKSSNFTKFKKHTLRRATSGTDTGKIEKIKNRKKNTKSK